MATTRLSSKFNRCVKSVKKTVRARKGSNKESAAIGICTKSVLQTRGRTLKSYSRKRLITQPLYKTRKNMSASKQMATRRSSRRRSRKGGQGVGSFPSRVRDPTGKLVPGKIDYSKYAAAAPTWEKATPEELKGLESDEEDLDTAPDQPSTKVGSFPVTKRPSRGGRRRKTRKLSRKH